MKNKRRLILIVGAVAVVSLVGVLNATRPYESNYAFMGKARLVHSQDFDAPQGELRSRAYEVEADFPSYVSMVEKELIADHWTCRQRTDELWFFARNWTPNGDHQQLTLVISRGHPKTTGPSSNSNLKDTNNVQVQASELPRIYQAGFRGFVSRWLGI